jgi:hypothetical protein
LGVPSSLGVDLFQAVGKRGKKVQDFQEEKMTCKFLQNVS